MSYTLLLSNEATEDVLEGMDRYNSQKDGLGSMFYEHLWDGLILIEQMPLAYAVRYKNLRAYPLNKFPFMVYYSVEKTTKLITVVAVLHNKSDWKGEFSR